MKKKKSKRNAKGFLSQIDVQHVATAYFLHDFYTILAKVQHWVCKINQLPWEYNEKIEKMKSP